MSQPIDISPQALSTVKELLQRYLPGVTVWAYGSRVKWTAHLDSDLDLVVFANQEQRRNVANLREVFEESNLPFRVDVFIWDEVPEKFQEEIREGYVVMEGEEKRQEGASNEKPRHSPIGVLPAGWQLKKLGELCKKVCSGATPRGGQAVYLDRRDSHALIRSQQVFDRRFDSSDLVYISNKHAKELRNVEVHSGDILLNITGDGVTFGRTCIVPDDVLPACVNQHVAIIRLDVSGH